MKPISFVTEIHLMAFCCYSNHVVAKLLCKTSDDELWFVCSVASLHFIRTSATLQTSAVAAHLWHWLQTLTAGSLSSRKQPRAAAQWRSESVISCESECLVLPRASTLEPAFLLSYCTFPSSSSHSSVHTDIFTSASLVLNSTCMYSMCMCGRRDKGQDEK